MSHLTDYGFVFGPMEVTRLVGDERAGYWLQIKTAHQTVEIRVSPKGRKMQVAGPRKKYSDKG